MFFCGFQNESAYQQDSSEQAPMILLNNDFYRMKDIHLILPSSGNRAAHKLSDSSKDGDPIQFFKLVHVLIPDATELSIPHGPNSGYPF